MKMFFFIFKKVIDGDLHPPSLCLSYYVRIKLVLKIYIYFFVFFQFSHVTIVSSIHTLGGMYRRHPEYLANIKTLHPPFPLSTEC